jgi:two-component system response regulator FixJ
MTEPRIVHIVDDEEEVRRSTAFLLRMHDIECRCWPSGSAFLSGVDIEGTGCVILDVRMKGEDGLEVQRELAARQSRLKVIMVSGHANSVVARRAMEAGAVDFIEKPYDEARLLRNVEQALSISGL